ncbi:MAG TPA: hypothetical protein PLS28_01105 [Clostridiales bacterium]|nr:hypothetical protein [Clostridiales bacterium]
MAYVETGKKAKWLSKKKWIAAMAAALAVLLIFLLLLTLCPRGLVQFFTTDKSYTEYIVAEAMEDLADDTEDLRTLWDKDATYSAIGGVTAELTAYGVNELGGEKAGREFSSYLASTKMDWLLRKNGTDREVQFSWADPDGPVLALTQKKIKNSTYLNISNLETGWMVQKEAAEGSVQENPAQLWQGAGVAVKRRLYKALREGYRAVEKDISYSVSDKMELQVQGKRVTGTRCHILLDKATVEKWIEITCRTLKEDETLRKALNKERTEALSEEAYRDLITSLETAGKKLLQETGMEKLLLEFYVNRKNETVAVTGTVKSSKEDILLQVIREAEDGGSAGLLRIGKKNAVRFSCTPDREKKGAGSASLTVGKLDLPLRYEDVEKEDQKLYGHFTADKVSLPGAEDWGELALDLVLSKQKDGNTAVGASINSETWGALIFQFTLYESSPQVISVPKQQEQTEYRKDELSEKLVSYFLTDLPKKSDSYNNMYKNIINGLYRKWITAAFLEGGTSA